MTRARKEGYMNYLEFWQGRLAEFRASIEEDPLANPVRQLGYEISVALEAGILDLKVLDGFIASLSTDGLENRAHALVDYLGYKKNNSSINAYKDYLKKVSPTELQGRSFIDYWQETQDVIVFTGHPTFLLSDHQRDYIKSIAIDEQTDNIKKNAKSEKGDINITLDKEHKQVLKSLENASKSISLLNRSLIEIAKEKGIKGYTNFTPKPVQLASWVGYDMDGRNDIGWISIIKHRLVEKKIRLDWYLERLDLINDDDNVLSEIRSILEKNVTHLEAVVALFDTDLSSELAVSDLANKITNFTDNLTRASDIIKLLDIALEKASGPAIDDILNLKADISCFQLGLGEVHFRLNSAQVRNAARHALDLNRDEDLFGKQALSAVQDLIERTHPVEVNFGSLAIEQTTAVRLFISIAQIIKHIDAEQPIRLLIAECENPVTILSCIYLARKFGVAEHIDICPLFETAFALDRSRRILDVLFHQGVYRDYARARGRIAVQSGFSDAGRFMGQVPAGLAIERLQGHLAQLIEAHNLSDLTAIVFNTHGESLGRGHHQASIEDRILYAMSPWARMQFEQRGIRLISEASYQGGDGFLLFDDTTISDCVVQALVGAWQIARDSKPEEDEFYLYTSTSLDFYRNVKASQSHLYAQDAYQRTVTALGLSMLPVTGSRVVRRQSDARKSEDTSLRQVRAIPHNASLQQIGLLANLFGGIGEALSKDHDKFVELVQKSDRFRRVMTLVALSKSRSDIKVAIAYMKLFDGSLWATRPLTGRERNLEPACAILGNLLAGDKRYFAALQLAAILRSDSIGLTRTIKDMNLEIDRAHPLCLDVLHGIRIAIIQHIFLLGARLPKFSVFAGHSRDDILNMLFKLEVEAACDLLKEIFPVNRPDLTQFSLSEKASYPAGDEPLYQTIHEEFIEPLLECKRLILSVSNGVSQYHQAFG